VGYSPPIGEGLSEDALTNLLRKGERIAPAPGIVAETAEVIGALFEKEGGEACFGLTPDGHLVSHQPIVFDPARATEQVIALMEQEIAADDREEALAEPWLCLGYHNHDFPTDFGGLLLGGKDGKPRCCYLDVKRTQALPVESQRTKLEQRARERKLGLMAQTLTTVANNGFAGYPGRGQPGLLVTMLVNPVSEGRTQAGFAVNWFFGIASNYQASAARWGWGGPLEVRLPPALLQQLEGRQADIGSEAKNWLTLLTAFRDYGQFRDEAGNWDRQSLRATLQAMNLAARYLLMNEDLLEQAQSSLANLQPADVKTPLRLEEFHPGDSLAAHYGRLADVANDKLKEAAQQRDEVAKQRDEAAQQRDEAAKQRDAAAKQRDVAAKQRDVAAKQRDEVVKQHDEVVKQRDEVVKQRDEARDLVMQSVARRRSRGHPNSEIAEDLGYSLDDFLRLFPPQN